jgi:hypothetical protein
MMKEEDEPTESKSRSINGSAVEHHARPQSPSRGNKSTSLTHHTYDHNHGTGTHRADAKAADAAIDKSRSITTTPRNAENHQPEARFKFEANECTKKETLADHQPSTDGQVFRCD